MRSAQALAGFSLHLAISGFIGVGAFAPLSHAPAFAQARAPALAGKVSSKEEGLMEGVMVSAKRQGSTMMISVATNARGEYAFPADRLEPGVHDITMRAIGYTLPDTKVTKIGRAHV